MVANNVVNPIHRLATSKYINFTIADRSYIPAKFVVNLVIRQVG